MQSHRLSYSQWKAAFAVAKASLISTLRSPTSVVFALLFPLIFVTVFGAMVDNTAVKIKMTVLSSDSKQDSFLLRAVQSIDIFMVSVAEDSLSAVTDLQKGRIGGVLRFDHVPANVNGQPRFTIQLFASGATQSKLSLIQTALQSVVNNINTQLLPGQPSVAHLETLQVPGRVYRMIDFILPGQLGFSLLMAGVFGSAFSLFNLRHTLVLKRVFATPVSPSFFLMGEMLSRLLFQVICFIIITAIGHYAFDFTLVHGWITFIEMLLLSVFGLIIFTGIGFFISGLISNESSIAPIANTITVPQILLCGLFFPVENYPGWLRGFCDLLPLTFLVNGLRKIAFEGAHIWQITGALTGLTLWTCLVILVCTRSLRRSE
ncbi:MAG: ABC transporter permease [Agriterribacter sp.]